MTETRYGSWNLENPENVCWPLIQGIKKAYAAKNRKLNKPWFKKNRGLFFHNHFGDRGLFVSTQPLRNVVKDADHYTWSVEQNTVKLLPVLEEKSKHSAHSILVTDIPQQPAKGSWPLCSPLMLRQKDPNSSPRESEIRKYWKLRACLWATDACA